MIPWILISLSVWFVVSQVLAAVILYAPREAPTENERQSVRAGMFLLPILLAMFLLAYLTWHLLLFAKFMRWPVEVADNPMEYLP